MEFKPADISQKSMYKILIGSVLPRPIGWISTIDSDGKRNLAPYSFFNIASSMPPHVLYCPQARSTDLGEKDSLVNVRQTGEFVVNIVTEDIIHAMNQTSAELPHGVDEFEFAGLTPIPSVRVKPPRVAESPIHFECVLHQLIELGSGEGAGTVVIGEIVHVHIDESVLIGEDKINLSVLKPVGRLAGNSYARATDLIDIQRPPSHIKPVKKT